MRTNHLSIITARADALFASTLQRTDDPSTAQIRQAISTAIRACGARGCAAQVAQAYGEHPETAAPRMRWARAEVTRAFGGGRPEPARAPVKAATARATTAGTTMGGAPVRGAHAAAGGASVRGLRGAADRHFAA
ncbi:MAG: hypothetical protein ACRDOB_21865 [Streptosporangiaceae bacterium]